MDKPAISAVIFDLDGTLIDSKDVMRGAYFKAYQEIVGDDEAPPFDEYCRHLGRSFPEIMRRLGLPAAMHAVFVRESISNMHKIRLFDGIRPLLQELARRQVPLAIATGKDYARTCSILTCLGLGQHFQMVVGSDNVSQPKPAPEMALKIAAHLELDCASALFVGDAIADLQCGQQAGMQTALATWDCPSLDALRHRADFHFDSPNKILSTLRIDLHANLIVN